MARAPKQNTLAFCSPETHTHMTCMFLFILIQVLQYIGCFLLRTFAFQLSRRSIPYSVDDSHYKVLSSQADSVFKNLSKQLEYVYYLSSLAI